MPTVAELERLRALIALLEPLSRKRRGELIEAEDWNSVVQSMVDVTRLALASDRQESVAPHEHPDEVTLGWLDARLRQLITAGGLTDPAAQGELSKVERDLTRISARLDTVDESVKDVRFRVADVSTKDLAREANVTRVTRKVDGLDDARADVSDLRTTLRTLEVDVRRAVEVGQRLEVDGQTVDMTDLLRRVAAGEELRERLTAANGELLDASAFERRLAGLETSLVTEAELTDALRDLRGRDPVDRDQLLEAARQAARDSVEGSVESLGADLRGMLDRRLAQVEPAVDAAVERATGALSEQILEVTRSEMTALVAEGGAGLRDELSADLDRRVSAVSGSVDERVSAALEAISGRVTEALDSRLPDLLGTTEERLAAVQEAHAALDGQVRGLTADQQAAATRVEVGLREEAAGRALLRADLTTRMEATAADLDERVDQAVVAMREGLRSDLKADIAASRRDLEAALAATVREAVTTEVQLLGTRLESEVRVVVRQELDATRADLERAIAERAAAHQTQIAGLVANEVQRGTADFPEIVRKEFRAFRPEIERLVDERIRTRPINRNQPPERPKPARPRRPPKP